MTTFIALLRAVNVGGRKVEMAKLRNVAIDKAMGSPTTARNWNTVRKLGELAKA